MSKLIPHEIIVEILSYLPVKSLLRFKCVSKPWYSIISSSQFAKLHLRHVKEENDSNRYSKILLASWPIAYSVDFEVASDADNYQAVLELSYPETFVGPNYSYVEILGSCNGLVCLSNNNFDIILWNPSTRASKTLPKPDNISLGFILFSGLGYDNSTDDYKLIIASDSTATGARETTAEIFTLGSNSWKKFQDLYDIIGVVRKLGIYFDQSLHWLGWRENNMGTEILNFDIAEERFKKVLKLPNNYEKEGLYGEMNLGMSKNSLCVFCEHQGNYFETLVLNGLDINATWTQLFKVPHDRFGGYTDIPLCVTNKGKVVFDGDGFRLGLYDPHDSKITFFEIRHRNEWESTVYLETLVSPYY